MMLVMPTTTTDAFDSGRKLRSSSPQRPQPPIAAASSTAAKAGPCPADTREPVSDE